MKSKFFLSGGATWALVCAATVCLAPLTATQAAQNKVRVMVKENQTHGTAPAKEEKEKPEKGAKNNTGVKTATPPKNDPKGKEDMYTHSTNHSLTIAVVNTTRESLELTIKATFLGKDEGGKHEVGPDKTLEKKVTLEPGKSEEYTSEEVTFTHTSAHRTAPAGKGGKPTNVPASGKQYVGYKVEVYSGNDLVGSDARGGSSF